MKKKKNNLKELFGDICFFIYDEIKKLLREFIDKIKLIFKSEKMVITIFFYLVLISAGFARNILLPITLIWIIYYLRHRWYAGEWKYHRRQYLKKKEINKKLKEHGDDYFIK